jgi:hypothetical protein
VTKIEQIEQAIVALKPEEVSKLGAWFDEFRESLWDKQLEQDAANGQLDSFADKALADHKAGRSRPL